MVMEVRAPNMLAAFQSGYQGAQTERLRDAANERQNMLAGLQQEEFGWRQATDQRDFDFRVENRDYQRQQAEEAAARAIAQAAAAQRNRMSEAERMKDIQEAEFLLSTPMEQRIEAARLLGMDVNQFGDNADMLLGDLALRASIVGLGGKVPSAPEPIKVGDRLVVPDGAGGYREAYAPPPEGPAFSIVPMEEVQALGLDPSQRYQRGADGRITPISGGGVTINTGDMGPRVGTIPPGMMLIGEGENARLIAIPGGPAAERAATAEGAAAAGAEQAGTAAGVVIDNVSRLRNLITNQNLLNPVTGVGGAVASRVPGSAAADARALSDTIRANIAFDTLRQMREASPTGGALGAVSQNELALLESTVGSIAFSQSEEQLLRNLDVIDKLYTRIMRKFEAYPGQGMPSGGGPRILSVEPIR